MGVNVPSSGSISNPCRGRSSSRMISGRRRETTYEQTENLKPGKISSVTAAPPSTCRRSSTSTRLPARARYAALTRPLWPPPMTIQSYLDVVTYVVFRKDIVIQRTNKFWSKIQSLPEVHARILPRICQRDLIRSAISKRNYLPPLVVFLFLHEFPFGRSLR